jgi:DNA polymerase III subunit delta'
VSWQRVRGHDALVRAFQRVVQRGRLAHAYLFTGQTGVGKKLFATELARALLCERPRADLSGRSSAFDACDRCPACIQVEAGTHPDFQSVRRPDEALEFPIEVMRELCQRFSLKSARGRGKVVIIDDADDLNEESANCFLKTLEEPPPRSVLILIGTSPDRQLSTIVSRCQVVNFAPLPPGEVASLLRAGGIEDEGLLQRVLPLSEGSPGVARALSDPALWEFRRSLVRILITPRVNSVELARQWNRFVEEAGKESAAQRQRASLCLGLLLSFLQDALRVAVGSEARLTDPEDQAALQFLAGRLEPERLLELMERCLEGDFHIDRRVQLGLALEALSDTLGRQMDR